MKAFLRFLRKEVLETVRTWRLPVVAGPVMLFAVTGPIMALFTPELLESMQASQPGLVIQVPDPTHVDAYLQWVKNLGQIVAFVSIIVSAGSVAGEVASGTAMLVVTKPVSRTLFVVAKWVSFVLLLVVCVGVGAATTQGVTLAVFGEAPGAGLWAATGAWLLYATVLVSVSLALSTRLSTLAAAGASIGVFFALSLASLWGPLVRNTFVGLAAAPAGLLAGTETALGWPIATAIISIAALLAIACVSFERREL